MKLIYWGSLILTLTFSGFSQASEWSREDLYKKGRAAVAEDCFKAIQLLSSFSEINSQKLVENKKLKVSISSEIKQCKNKILDSRKVEYVFLPAEKECSSDAQSSGSVVESGSSLTQVKYKIVKKKGNPNGMEVPEYDVYFELETPNSKISYPLLPTLTEEGEFLPYRRLLNEKNLQQGVGYSETILRNHIESEKLEGSYELPINVIDQFEKRKLKLESLPNKALHGTSP